MNNPIISLARRIPLPGERAAIAALRWSMVFIFAMFGIAKFALYEAEGVAGIATQHPLLAWLYPLFGVQGASNVIGTVELIACALIAIGQWSRGAALLGALMGMATFAITLSFTLGAPLWQEGYGFPFMGQIAQFLFKDAVLFAACLALAVHARAALAR